MIHTVKGFGIVNKAEIDVFLELSCFCDDPVDGMPIQSGDLGGGLGNANALADINPADILSDRKSVV